MTNPALDALDELVTKHTTNHTHEINRLQNIIRSDLAQKTVTREDVIHHALASGFMISTRYGQGEGKIMPVTDTGTLWRFVDALIAAGVVNVKDEK